MAVERIYYYTYIQNSNKTAVVFIKKHRSTKHQTKLYHCCLMANFINRKTIRDCHCRFWNNRLIR